MSGTTPFQTVGPYLSIGFRAGLRAMRRNDSGTPIIVQGKLVDGAGEGIPDGALEFWHLGFAGMGRVLTDANGRFRLETMKPPPLAGADGVVMAPHFAVRVLARGILTQYLSRMYFDDEPHTADDPILALVPVGRRATLIARHAGEGEYHFDVVVQGAHETVFFDL